MMTAQTFGREHERLAHPLLNWPWTDILQGGQAMTNHIPKLTDRDVLLHARTRLQAHLPLHADGSVCTTSDLLQVLLGVAVTRGTIEAICCDLLGTPDPETIRRYLNAQLRVDDLPALLDHVNAALTDKLPNWLWASPHDMAIDFTDRPYYGRLPQAQGLWVRGQAKAGTTRFYRVATASVLMAGMRLTLAIHFVLPGESPMMVLEQLIERLERLGVRPRRLFLDKGFAGT